MPKQKGGKMKAKEVKDFLNASYEKSPPNNLDGYILDKSLSTDTAKVYYNPQTNHAVVAHRGTQGVLDWGNNLAYAVGAYNLTSRYKKGKSVQDKAEKKYGKQNISTLGHSQGSILARKLGTDTKEVINVNPAYTGERPARNEYNIRSSTDVVSGLYAPVSTTREMLFPKYSEKHDITIPSQSATDVLGEHSYNILDRIGEKEIGVGAGNKLSSNNIMYSGGKRYNRLGYTSDDIDWIGGGTTPSRTYTRTREENLSRAQEALRNIASIEERQDRERRQLNRIGNDPYIKEGKPLPQPKPKRGGKMNGGANDDGSTTEEDISVDGINDEQVENFIEEIEEMNINSPEIQFLLEQLNDLIGFLGNPQVTEDAEDLMNEINLLVQQNNESSDEEQEGAGRLEDALEFSRQQTKMLDEIKESDFLKKRLLRADPNKASLKDTHFKYGSNSKKGKKERQEYELKKMAEEDLLGKGRRGKNPFKKLQKGLTKVGKAFGKAGETLNPMSYAIKDKGTREAMVQSGEATHDYALPAVVSAGKPIYDATAIVGSTMLTGNPVLGKAVADTMWNEMVAKKGYDPRQNQKSAELGELSGTLGQAVSKPYTIALGGGAGASVPEIPEIPEIPEVTLTNRADRRYLQNLLAEIERYIFRQEIIMAREANARHQVSVPTFRQYRELLQERDNLRQMIGAITPDTRPTTPESVEGGSNPQETPRERADQISPIIENHFRNLQNRMRDQVDFGLYDDDLIQNVNNLGSRYRDTFRRFRDSNSIEEQDSLINEMNDVGQSLTNYINEAVERYGMYRDDERTQEHINARRRMRGMRNRREPVRGKPFVPPTDIPKRGQGRGRKDKKKGLQDFPIEDLTIPSLKKNVKETEQYLNPMKKLIQQNNREISSLLNKDTNDEEENRLQDLIKDQERLMKRVEDVDFLKEEDKAKLKRSADFVKNLDKSKTLKGFTGATGKTIYGEGRGGKIGKKNSKKVVKQESKGISLEILPEDLTEVLPTHQIRPRDVERRIRELEELRDRLQQPLTEAEQQELMGLLSTRPPTPPPPQEEEEYDFVGMGRDEKIDFSKVKWGSFTRMFKEFKKENPKARVKDLEAFAHRIIKNKKNFSDKAFKKAQFYLNVLKK